MYICDNISLSFSWNEKCPRHPLQTKSKHTFVVEKVSDKNNRYFTRGSMHIYDNISLSLSWNEKCPRHPLQTKSKHTFVVETFFIFFENRTVYGIMWKNVVDQGAPQLTT